MPFFLLSQTLFAGHGFLDCSHIGIIEAGGIEEIARALGGEARMAALIGAGPTGVIERDIINSRESIKESLKNFEERFGDFGDTEELAKLREIFTKDLMRIELELSSLGDQRDIGDDEGTGLIYIFLPEKLFIDEGPGWCGKGYIWKHQGVEFQFGYEPLQGVIRWVVLSNWGGPKWRESQPALRDLNKLLTGIGAPQEIWELEEAELLTLWEEYKEWTTDDPMRQTAEEYGAYIECRELPTLILEPN